MWLQYVGGLREVSSTNATKPPTSFVVNRCLFCAAGDRCPHWSSRRCRYRCALRAHFPITDTLALRVKKAPGRIRVVVHRIVLSSAVMHCCWQHRFLRSAGLAQRQAGSAIDRVDDGHVLDCVLRRRFHSLAAQHCGGEGVELVGVGRAARETFHPFAVS